MLSFCTAARPRYSSVANIQYIGYLLVLFPNATIGYYPRWARRPRSTTRTSASTATTAPSSEGEIGAKVHVAGVPVFDEKLKTATASIHSAAAATTTAARMLALFCASWTARSACSAPAEWPQLLSRLPRPRALPLMAPSLRHILAMVSAAAATRFRAVAFGILAAAVALVLACQSHLVLR